MSACSAYFCYIALRSHDDYQVRTGVGMRIRLRDMPYIYTCDKDASDLDDLTILTAVEMVRGFWSWYA